MQEENGKPIVLVQDVGRVRVLTMNRPDKLNAFNDALFSGLADSFADATVADNIHVVVLTGAGRAFSAGADLQQMGNAATATSPEVWREPVDDPFARLQQIVESFPKPLVAAVNGVGVGLGRTLRRLQRFRNGEKARRPGSA